MIRLRPKLAAERGIALPIALGVLFVVAGLAAVAAHAAINANHSSYRDSNYKRAIQAANAGVKAAAYQLNLMQPTVSECVIRASSGSALSTQAAPTSGWCPTQTEDLGGNGSYTFQTSRSTSLALNSNGQAETERVIVSTGTVNGFLRRVLVRVSAPGGTPLFPKGYAVVSLSPPAYSNSVTITGNVGSNGDITLNNSATIVGNATPGAGKTVKKNGTGGVSGTTIPAQQPFSLAPVNQRGAPTNNDNGRIGGLDPTSGSVSFNAATRVLSLSGAATLTLTGNVYSFCRIQTSNSSKIRIAARGATQPPVRIYMDTPENCGGGAGMGSVQMDNNSQFENLNNNPATLVLEVSGSASIATSVVMSPNSPVYMGIYAPFSTVNIFNANELIGAVVAKQVGADNSTKITYDSRMEGFAEDPLFVYHRTEYLECTNVATLSAPDSGC